MKLSSLYADFPSLIPAHSRVRVRIYLSDGFDSSELRAVFGLKDANLFDQLSEDEKISLNPNRAVAHRWANLNGFVVYDSQPRYQIDSPRGW